MKSVSQIYSEYRIQPSLQRHQMRVAAVAKTICDNLKEAVDTDSVVDACLFHDMGNIIKFDLTYFPDFVQPEGLEYWQKVKDDFITKYGPDEHLATEKIALEIGVSKKAFSFLRNVGFSNLDKVVLDPSLEQKICSYADMRVGPHGVISIKDRIADGTKRYKDKKHAIGSDKGILLFEALQEVEKQIFELAKISPTDINDEVVGGVTGTFSSRSISRL